MSFRFALCDKVAICVSDERGVVIGRAEYANAENGYLVRYKAADGQAIESWWGESAPQALGSASRVEITKNGTRVRIHLAPEHSGRYAETRCERFASARIVVSDGVRRIENVQSILQTNVFSHHSHY